MMNWLRHFLRNEKIRFTITACFFYIAALYLFPLQSIVSYEKKDNPKNCPYYISLQSYLTLYPGLAFDNANVRLIKNKLLQFEKDVIHTPRPSIADTYLIKYKSILQKNGLSSIRQAPTQRVIELANSVFPIVDNFYLDKRLFCDNPYYDWGTKLNRRFLRYNLNGLFDHLPNRYSRVLSAIGDDWLSGSPSGIFLNNQTTTMDTRFLVGMPLLTALYVEPKFNYVEVGGYFRNMQWSYYRASHFSDVMTRKVIDVGGIDVIIVNKKDLAQHPIPNSKLLTTDVHPRFGDWLQPVENLQSYGMAYIAHHVLFAPAKETLTHERHILRYFRHHQFVEQFMSHVFTLYHELLKLQHKHDIILEAPPKEISAGLGDVTIKGIVGERALFNTDCKSKNCIFVFNTAAAPGWHVFVNGKAEKLMRANYAFLAVNIPAGKSVIWFIYESLLGLISYFISAFTLIFILITFIHKQTKGQLL